MIKYRAARAAFTSLAFAAVLTAGGTAAADTTPTPSATPTPSTTPTPGTSPTPSATPGTDATQAGCAPASAAWQTSARQSFYQHGPFILDSNEWNPVGGKQSAPASPMTTWAGRDTSWGVCTNQPGTGWPYPEERLMLGNTPMSSLAAIMSGYDETTPQGGMWDSAYDIWVRSPAGAPRQTPREVMIWTANHGEWTGNPRVVGNVTIAGHRYQMSVCDSCNRVTFVFPSDVPATTVNLLAVLRYAAHNPASTSITGRDPVITEIDRGWEIYKTEGTQAFTTNSYWLDVVKNPLIQRKPTRKPAHKPALKRAVPRKLAHRHGH